MAETFKLEIVTPYRMFYAGPAEMIVIVSVDGELGIMADHEPIVTPVTIGVAKIKINGVWKQAAFSDGFLEMEENKLTVLVGAAEWPEEIDIDRAQRSLKRAADRLADTTMPWETNRAQLAKKRAENRLKVAESAAKSE
jgi:F-type H+-transporting ATPase subunit epsilon